MIKWIAMFILLWFIYQVREVFPPIVVGGIIAYLLLPLVKSLAERAKIPIGVSTLVVYVVIATLLGLLVWWFIPRLFGEIQELGAHRHDIVKNVVEQVVTQ